MDRALPDIQWRSVVISRKNNEKLQFLQKKNLWCWVLFYIFWFFFFFFSEGIKSHEGYVQEKLMEQIEFSIMDICWSNNWKVYRLKEQVQIAPGFFEWHCFFFPQKLSKILGEQDVNFYIHETCPVLNWKL